MIERRSGFGSLLLTTAILAGCQTTNIEIADSFTTTTYAIAERHLTVGGAPVVMSTKGIGIFVDNSSLSIGWKSETRVLIAPDTCKTVIISENVEDIKRLTDVLASGGSKFDNLCVLKGSE